MYQVSVERKFRASHQIIGLEDRHEHTWKVKITTQSDKLNKFGITIDFKELSLHLEEIVQELDGSDLNRLIEIPSCENIARYIYERLKLKLPDLISVEVTEGDYGTVRFES